MPTTKYSQHRRQRVPAVTVSKETTSACLHPLCIPQSIGTEFGIEVTTYRTVLIATHVGSSFFDLFIIVKRKVVCVENLHDVIAWKIWVQRYSCHHSTDSNAACHSVINFRCSKCSSAVRRMRAAMSLRNVSSSTRVLIFS